MLNPELRSLYDRYRLELKPLIAEFESRNEKFVTHLLSDIPFMFDNIALFEISSSGKDEYKAKAEEHLDHAIFNIRFCLVASMMCYVKQFKSRFSKESLELFDSGRFYPRFIQLENDVRTITKAIYKLLFRKHTENDLKQAYDKLNANALKQAYDKLKEMENMISEYHAGSLVNGLLKDSKVVTLFKWGFSIAVALLINYLILKLA